MKSGRLLKTEDKSCVIPKVFQTTNFLERMRGLLFRPQLNKDEALLIEPCRSVHTIGMTYPIDLVFLDKDWTIVKIVTQLFPWRSASCLQARRVLEMTGGNIDNLQLSDGQHLEWHDKTTSNISHH